MEINKKAYEAYVKQVTPVHKKWPGLIKAFFVGGIICTLGQLTTTLFMNTGMEKEAASAWTTLVLIAATVILTGFNIYPKITKFGGAGAWCRSRDLPIPLSLRLWNLRRKARCLESAVKSLPLPVPSYYMGY